MRTLDDVYGPDLDRFPLEQEVCPPGIPLNWSEFPLAEVPFADFHSNFVAAHELAKGQLYWGPNNKRV